MSEILIRPATSADAASFPDIERSAGEAFLAIPGLEWIAGDDVMSAAQHQIYIDEGTAWVALSDNRPVGFVTAARHDDALHILELSVESGQQGHGIGRRLMETAKAHASTHGVPALSLTTFRDLPFNERFYRKLGYRTLETPALPQRLADILQAEIDNGLPGDRRCAMRLDI
ncbi:GNAT family N-acetyltransferase [Parasphingorhabdus sp.]|uniref:GNAT family N-acetyltransferase n=1 Tax=Parasphingorhabdus sp. TaxID=2709688 RepID=UPI003001731C